MAQTDKRLNAITFKDFEKDVEIEIYNNTRNVPFYKWQPCEELHLRLTRSNGYICTFSTYCDDNIKRLESLAACAVVFASAASENDKVIDLLSKYMNGDDLDDQENTWLKVEYGLHVCPHEIMP